MDLQTNNAIYKEKKALFTFLKLTKEGKYAKIDKCSLPYARIEEQREEYEREEYEEEYYYSVR